MKGKKKPEPCILDTCIWKNNPEAPLKVKQDTCRQCYERNDLQQQNIEWCKHFVEHYVSLEEPCQRLRLR